MVQPASSEQRSQEVHAAKALEEAFVAQASAAAAQVSLTQDVRSAVQIIGSSYPGVLRCSADVLDSHPALREALVESGLQVEAVEETNAQQPDTTALAVSLTGETSLLVARAGIAETGSLVLAYNSLASRLLSMLADVCVVLLSASAIVRDLDEAGKLLAELNRTGHRYVSLVTGPSRTADIERVLTIGVQGPKALHIIIVEELS